MTRKSIFVTLAALAGLFVGCGPRPVTGGVTGVLRAGGHPASDIQVIVHEPDGAAWRAVGFGVAGSDGAFELFANNASGPLWLAPGEYRCTLESVGAPVQIPREYTSPETTPLKISWSPSDDALNFEIPALPLLR